MQNRFQNNIYRILIIFLFIISTNYAATYYVDGSNGNDNNSGLSPDQAWQTINKVNNFSFQSGDSICFKRNERFVGYTLHPPKII